jgi:hypothetical protein
LTWSSKTREGASSSVSAKPAGDEMTVMVEVGKMGVDRGAKIKRLLDKRK